jgi:hypothetical protein
MLSVECQLAGPRVGQQEVQSHTLINKSCFTLNPSNGKEIFVYIVPSGLGGTAAATPRTNELKSFLSLQPFRRQGKFLSRVGQ